jgi:hypothetical protein
MKMKKITIELEEPYAKEVELRAYRSGQTWGKGRAFMGIAGS